jgi:hypothetical protein
MNKTKKTQRQPKELRELDEVRFRLLQLLIFTARAGDSQPSMEDQF